MGLLFYNFILFQKKIYGANVVIFEGIMSFVNKELLTVSECSFIFIPVNSIKGVNSIVGIVLQTLIIFFVSQFLSDQWKYPVRLKI